ncbi:MAG: HEAT repeat domain-containing protein [Candidatus Gracilibacteria bacterium]|jgi:HEAT repeat protein
MFGEKLTKLLNVSSTELPRILVAWLLVFLIRTSFIIGGSVLLAVFLSKVGIDLLPGLFLINALFMMVGAFGFRKIIHKIRRELLVVSIVFLAAISLLGSLFFLERDTLLFFVFFLIAESVFLSQLNILISLFNEELFSPLESQRCFPIIESAETVGGIIGGLSLTVFAEVLPTYKFILICVLLALAILPVVLLFNPKTMPVPHIEAHEEKTHKKLKDSFKEFRKIPFLKTLMLVILFHWAIINMLEFQYTKAIQQDVYSTQEETLVMESGDEVHLAAEPSSEDYQHDITQKLGTLHLIFNSAALFMQLIVAGRILSFLGITASMLLHPLVTFLNMIWMLLRFNFFSASMARGGYELTGILFKNAYDSSYYAIPHSMRMDVKEWMQGVMKPLGAILGTLLMIGLAFGLNGATESLAINLTLVLLSGGMAVLCWSLGKKYTHMSEENLSHKLDLPTRLNAIEILAQKGHEKTTNALQKILKRSSEPEIIKEDILNTLGLQEDPDSIASILEMLDHKNERLRLAAAEALSHFHKLKEHLIDQSFTRYRVIEALKNRLNEEEVEAIREELVLVFHDLAPDALTEFLVERVKKEGRQKASFIRMLSLFHDPNLKFYLEGQLSSRDPGVKAASIIALWQFKTLGNELRHHLKQMLESPKEEVLKKGIEACGFVKEKSFKEELKKHLNHGSPEIKKAVLLALGQMEEESTIPHLVEALSDPSHEWFHKSFSLLAKFPKQFRALLQNALDLRISEKINQILSKEKDLNWTSLPEESLHLLHELYQKINAHHEVHKIKEVLTSRQMKQ